MKIYKPLHVPTFMTSMTSRYRTMKFCSFNWQSINQAKNIFVRENENEFNLSKVIENTKNTDREIILIIDESHHTASSEKSREVIERIDPKVTIEVSATPKISTVDYVQEVDIQEVKEEEMIKKICKTELSTSQNPK